MTEILEDAEYLGLILGQRRDEGTLCYPEVLKSFVLCLSFVFRTVTLI